MPVRAISSRVAQGWFRCVSCGAKRRNSQEPCWKCQSLDHDHGRGKEGTARPGKPLAKGTRVRRGAPIRGKARAHAKPLGHVVSTPVVPWVAGEGRLLAQDRDDQSAPVYRRRMAPLEALGPPVQSFYDKNCVVCFLLVREGDPVVPASWKGRRVYIHPRCSKPFAPAGTPASQSPGESRPSFREEQVGSSRQTDPARVLERVRMACALNLNERADEAVGLGQPVADGLVNICLEPGVPVLGRLCALKALGALGWDGTEAFRTISARYVSVYPIIAKVCRQPRSAFLRRWDQEKLKPYANVRPDRPKRNRSAGSWTKSTVTPYTPGRDVVEKRWFSEGPRRRSKVPQVGSGQCLHGVERANCRYCRPGRY